MTSKAWNQYDDFKEADPRTREYYGAVHRCHALALRSLIPDKIEAALDIACGYGDSTQLLAPFARRIDGVDSSQQLIEIARRRSSNDCVQFHCCSFEEFAPTRQYDLVSASWFLNHIHTDADLVTTAKRIGELITPNGVVSFVVPSDAFTTRRIQLMGAELGWRQAWFQEETRFTRGVFNYCEDEYIPTTVWQPLFILQAFRPWTRLSCWDVKATIAEERLLPELESEPPFEILYGHRCRSGEECEK